MKLTSWIKVWTNYIRSVLRDRTEIYTCSENMNKIEVSRSFSNATSKNATSTSETLSSIVHQENRLVAEDSSQRNHGVLNWGGGQAVIC